MRCSFAHYTRMKTTRQMNMALRVYCTTEKVQIDVTNSKLIGFAHVAVQLDVNITVAELTTSVVDANAHLLLHRQPCHPVLHTKDVGIADVILGRIVATPANCRKAVEIHAEAETRGD